MIYLTRLNHHLVLLNCDLIEYVEATPDTVISLTTGQKLMVLETPDEVAERVANYRRSIVTGWAQPVRREHGGAGPVGSGRNG